MKLDEIKKMIDLLVKSKLHKLSIKQGDFELHLEKKQEVPILNYELKKEACLTKEEISSVKKDESLFVKSPMVGTFYISPATDKPPFIKEGDRVTEDTVVCIIEAMKVMNEVKAGVSGVIKEVLCNNASPIEFGTKLFKIEKK